MKDTNDVTLSGVVSEMISLIIGSVLVWVWWNGVIPEVFDIPRINVFQALCLIMLSRCLLRRNKKDD